MFSKVQINMEKSTFENSFRCNGCAAGHGVSSIRNCCACVCVGGGGGGGAVVVWVVGRVGWVGEWVFVCQKGRVFAFSFPICILL
jgi:hypothetical protein